MTAIFQIKNHLLQLSLIQTDFQTVYTYAYTSPWKIIRFASKAAWIMIKKCQQIFSFVALKVHDSMISHVIYIPTI